MLGARTGDWDDELLARAGIDPRVLPAVVEPGERAGTLRPELRDRLGLADDVPVLRSAGHDTAAAVAAVPGDGHVAYISSGTWSLAGVEHDAPVLDPAAMEAGFTNELGVGGRVRFQRNLTGLWLLEEALRQWGATTAEAVAAAEREGPVASRIDVGDPAFIATGDVLARIADACRRDAQAVPETLGQFTRCILQSLAAAYGETIARCVELTGRPVDVVHMVGGGSRNGLLCRLTAQACERDVLAGPGRGDEPRERARPGDGDRGDRVVRRAARRRAAQRGRRPLRAVGGTCLKRSRRSSPSRGRSATRPASSRSWARATPRCAAARRRCWSRPAARRSPR